MSGADDPADCRAADDAGTASGGGKPDDHRAEGPVDDELPNGGSEDEFDPVQVFSETEGMDLRPGSDDCYKCSVCDTNCPVAEVDDEFPGPKFQGPEQWRLKRKGDRDVDESVMKCSNCMRCDGACPSEVPLSQMHNTARGEYVAEQVPTLSREYARNKLLANYGRLAGFASRFPRTATLLLNNPVTKWLNERLLGITSEREFPAFARQPFREWWNERGGPRVESDERRVAYFHGDYANYNTPEVAKAMVRVYEHFGYEVAVPDQRCSGTPMFANGLLDDARDAAAYNVARLRELVADGYDVVCTCTSCSMALRQEYPELFDLEGVETVAANTYEAVEYLRIHEDLEGALGDATAGDGRAGAGDGDSDDADAPAIPDLAYHAPCHARNQGLGERTPELLAALEGVAVEDVGDSCSGISGTYGWKAEHYDLSMRIGEEMFEHMEAAAGDVGLTECPTCAMQMEHGTGDEVRHTMEVLEAALVPEDDAT